MYMKMYTIIYIYIYDNVYDNMYDNVCDNVYDSVYDNVCHYNQVYIKAIMYHNHILSVYESNIYISYISHISSYMWYHVS